MKACIVLISILILLTGCQAFQSKPNLPRDMTVSCLEGNSRWGPIEPMASGDTTCKLGMQRCKGGRWEGPILFERCDSFTKSCGSSPHGSTQPGIAEMSSNGTPCERGVKTCINGEWSEDYTKCTR